MMGLAAYLAARRAAEAEVFRPAPEPSGAEPARWGERREDHMVNSASKQVSPTLCPVCEDEEKRA